MSGGDPDPGAPRVDGRRRRSERSREKILDAVATAIEDAPVELTAERIAAGAGVSLSTISRHFGDLDGLSAAMRERVQARIVPILFGRPFEGSTRGRLRDLIQRRGEAFEILGPFQRVSLRNPSGGAQAREQQEELRIRLREQLLAALAPPLDEAADPDRVAVVEALLSPEAWTQLRTGQALAPERVEALLEASVMALLDAPLD